MKKQERIEFEKNFEILVGRVDFKVGEPRLYMYYLHNTFARLYLQKGE